jgi:hypothetical protein
MAGVVFWQCASGELVFPSMQITCAISWVWFNRSHVWWLPQFGLVHIPGSMTATHSHAWLNGYGIAHIPGWISTL